MTFGDLILIGSGLVALWYVPRYLWRVYGGAEMLRPLLALLSSWRGAERPPTGADTGSPDLVLRQQHQPEPELVLDFEGVLNYLRRHNLTDDQAIDLLALAHREMGDLMSANKIRDIVGGNEAQVKARVASHRPKADAPKPAQRLERPANGWGKAS